MNAMLNSLNNNNLLLHYNYKNRHASAKKNSCGKRSLNNMQNKLAVKSTNELAPITLTFQFLMISGEVINSGSE